MDAQLVVIVIIGGLICVGGAGGVGAKCTSDGYCKCRFEDGSVIDLSGLESESTVYRATSFNMVNNGTSWTLDTYLFHPCKDISLGMKNCGKASVCKRSVEFKQVNGSTNYTILNNEDSLIGRIEKSKISGTEDKIVIQFEKVEAVEVSVILTCMKAEDSSLQVHSNDPKTPVLSFFSPKACPVKATEPSHHSLGTTLLIIFFVLVLVYLITGCCVKHFMMGARGIEIIPNYNFWKELPLLVRDGVAFIQNGFRPPPQPTTSPGPNPNPNSYDSI